MKNNSLIPEEQFHSNLKKVLPFESKTQNPPKKRSFIQQLISPQNALQRCKNQLSSGRVLLKIPYIVESFYVPTGPDMDRKGSSALP
jgi:hypothetical protein